MFPNTVGYSGHAIKTKKTILYLDPKYRDKDYIEYDCEKEDEIDNFYQEHEISSALYVPLIDHNGNIQGVLQMVNFIYGPHSISNRIIEEIETTCEIIGSSI